jgi:hypothetical protein
MVDVAVCDLHKMFKQKKKTKRSDRFYWVCAAGGRRTASLHPLRNGTPTLCMQESAGDREIILGCLTQAESDL